MTETANEIGVTASRALDPPWPRAGETMTAGVQHRRGDADEAGASVQRAATFRGDLVDGAGVARPVHRAAGDHRRWGTAETTDGDPTPTRRRGGAGHSLGLHPVGLRTLDRPGLKLWLTSLCRVRSFCPFPQPQPASPIRRTSTLSGDASPAFSLAAAAWISRRSAPVPRPFHLSLPSAIRPEAHVSSAPVGGPRRLPSTVKIASAASARSQALPLTFSSALTRAVLGSRRAARSASFCSGSSRPGG